jgi:restriction system protein
MAIPDFQSLMLPLLRYASGRSPDTSTSEALKALAEEFHLTPDDLSVTLASGPTPVFANRIGWAATYMRKAGLLETTQRGRYRITERGRELLATRPDRLSIKALQQYPEFLAWQKVKGTKTSRHGDGGSGDNEVITVTPSEALEAAYDSLRSELADDLLARLKKATPAFFEQAVVDLLVRMGYGGSRADAGRAIGRSGDEGIDGIIKEDRLGLDVVYIQAKRWDTASVSGPELQRFAGALQGQRASKGIFITTSTFTEAAKRFVQQIGVKIVLIEGTDLTNLMIEHDVGVSTVATYPVKRVDNDYFEESV